MSILALLMFLSHPVFDRHDVSLSCYLSGASSFVNQTDAPDAQTVANPNISVGSFGFPSSWETGLTTANKNYGLGLGFRQNFEFRLRPTYCTTMTTDNDFNSDASMNALYIEPFILFPQSNSGFFVLACKLGTANLDGTMKMQHSDGYTAWTASYNYNSQAMLIEPTVRQGWFLGNHAAVSFEFAYSFLRFNDVRVGGPMDVNDYGPFHTFPVGAYNYPPSFTVDASSCSFRIRIEAMLLNGFVHTTNPFIPTPEPPVVNP